MANPDTSLNKEKKYAQRWMAYTFPYLEVRDGKITNEVFAEATRAAHGSTCTNDLAEWESDGPLGMPDWEICTRKQTSGGWVDAVYNHPINNQVYLLGTRTSGIMRTTNGGENWVCVTDNLPFPVLGVRQMIAVPQNPNHILAITGTEWIKGNVIYSTDAGLSWTEVTQLLPQFYWMDFHPSIPGLLFAAAQAGIWYSLNNGISWQMNPTAPVPGPEITFWEPYKIIVFENRLYVNYDYLYGLNATLHRGDINFSGSTPTVTFTNDISNQILPPGLPTTFNCSFSDFSNKVGNTFYMMIEWPTSYKYLLRSTDGGVQFEHITTAPPCTSACGDNTTQCIDWGGFFKNELIASIQNPNVYYQGSIKEIRRFTVGSGTSTKLVGTTGNNGNHDDYRCSQILLVNGQERLVFGNDGGIGVVLDGLANNPTISSLNGNLSINLIHAFDVHERTGKTVFGFQDHFMISRDLGNIYSLRFLHEGSFAMSQQLFPNAIVGEYVTQGIMDKPDSENKIVATQNVPGTPGTLASGRTYLYGYQTHYRHFPERFARGLGKSNGIGGVALNRAKLDSDISQIPNCVGAVGPVAVCERDPKFLYAGDNDRDNHENILFKSINDGLTWSDLSQAQISNGLYPGITVRAVAAWLGIRALAVNHHNSNLMYVGIGGTFQQNQQPYPETYRVLKSTDGGQVFTDYSEGLPAIPLERLLTIDSENELIFCGTSAGVYYRTAGMSQWECFSNGLPRVMITGMKYDYCNNMLYVSTYGRGLWKTPVNLPVQNTFTVEINENTLWDTDRVMHDNVLVKAGKTLTITAKVEMGRMKTIRVEPNARLVVDGGHITNFCNGMWAGIEAHGNTSQHQYSFSGGQYHQGRAIFKNGAVIENAWQGVMNWNPADWGSRGGIIQATNTTFRNNRIDAIFMAYQNTSPSSTSILRPDQSFFSNCAFILNDDYLEDPNIAPPRPRITLWETDRVRIMGCDFINTQTVDASEKRSRAIVSIDAHYNVKGRCTTIPQVNQPCPVNNLDKSHFEGFHTAIHPSGGTGVKSPEIRDCIFDENMVAVFLDKANHAKVTFNEFLLGAHPFGPPLDQQSDANYHLGIKSEKTESFTIEQNNLAPSSNPNWLMHGVLVEEAGGNSNRIFKNSFTGLQAATIAKGLNKGNTAFQGLKFECNQNSGNNNDFELRQAEDGGFSYIARFQHGAGSHIRAAANTFSASDGLNDNFVHFDFYSDANYIYRFRNAIEPQVPNTNEIMVSNALMTTYGNGTNNTCLTNFPLGGGVIDLPGKLTEYNQSKTEYYNLLYTYHQFIDQGNTQAALNDVVQSWSNDAWTLRDELVDRSPYNSDTVLIAAANTGILPHGMLLEVLALNPSALQGGVVLNHVKCCIPNPMPQYMIDILIAGSNIENARTLTEQNLSSLHSSMGYAYNHLVQNYYTDTLEIVKADLEYLYSDLKTLEGRYQEAEWYLSQKDFTKAHAALDSIDIVLNPTGKQRTEFNTMRSTVTFMQNLAAANRTLAQLTQSEINSLLAIANNPNAGRTAASAENILCFFYDICIESAPSPKSLNTAYMKPLPPIEQAMESFIVLRPIPNPADQYVDVEYKTMYSSENTELVVWDLMGRRVYTAKLGKAYQGHHVLDSRKYQAGMYLLELKQDGKSIKKEKVIIQH